MVLGLLLPLAGFWLPGALVATWLLGGPDWLTTLLLSTEVLITVAAGVGLWRRLRRPARSEAGRRG